MDDRSGGATALLGMEGFVVLAMEEHEGEWWVLIETTAALVGCPDCGGRAIGHGRSIVQVRDLPVVGSPVRSCGASIGGAVRIPTACGGPSPRQANRSRGVSPDEREPRSAEGWVRRRAGGSSGQGLRCELVERHGRRQGPRETPRRRCPRLYRVRALGVDEHKMLAAGPRRPSVFATQLVELDRGRLLDVVPGRSAKSVGTWLDPAAGTGVSTSRW